MNWQHKRNKTFRYMRKHHKKWKNWKCLLFTSTHLICVLFICEHNTMTYTSIFNSCLRQLPLNACMFIQIHSENNGWKHIKLFKRHQHLWFQKENNALQIKLPTQCKESNSCNNPLVLWIQYIHNYLSCYHSIQTINAEHLMF